MKNLQKLMNQIEAVAFEVQFSVINNFKILLKALEHNEMLEELVQLIQDKPNQANILLKRLETLAADIPDEGMMHPHDITVLVYLYALSQADYPKLIVTAIEKVRETKGFYWAAKYAEYVWSSTHITEQISD